MTESAAVERTWVRVAAAAGAGGGVVLAVAVGGQRVRVAVERGGAAAGPPPVAEHAAPDMAAAAVGLEPVGRPLLLVGVDGRGILVAQGPPAHAVAGSSASDPVREVLRAAGVADAAARCAEGLACRAGPMVVATADGVAAPGPGGGPAVRRWAPGRTAAGARRLLRSHRGSRPWCLHGPGGTAGAVVAVLELGATSVEVCLGPPCGGVFLRCWPGVEVGPDAAGDAYGEVRLGRLAVALATAAPIHVAAVRAGLAAAEREALSEGADAERQARLMDEAGDDRGAEVRRAVAHAHATALCVAAMERLARAAGVTGPPLGATL